ncbi:MAG: hypothetical protein COW11_01395 [Candidatus Omnitrophica bacterium CG12_big_fil_rev_8_21_14_0_65_43_15]|uniref:RNA-binding protein n=1 Tax=Candidatus Taenaricola geysiri TaxID=1974752 RepID=A0A2J0LG26_9BACT|nr:MAG: hypothetical protein AUJ89_00730 [Candidatus Omnitrophica bacterium CG1_02_43_210]PIR66010.1 MAG: hypothetical protein COU52_01155 [Candidatus Omnitrophica bacterium CG10_big_fil_rev_8_21_14_0_10_43_8]PIV12255.1 MAG: hypothetical protein COS48_01795 [Candidatus Omnitrophica bacterium CG03_land_8_20_14_0_80_43_22]PIW66802.1 MAG: hypothetical protein COW11_01395 [Candidatus Omnitrophica bacterium CG12_big_fil_rev_8_21_14_0_65_43_15]PIW80736.1 MAG: hypothetical protein COZ98_00795 [Candida
MTFLFDGYNIIYKIARLEKKLDNSLEAARLALVSMVKAHSAKGNEYIVVFEGKDEHSGLYQQQTGGAIKVVFTRTHEEADNRIITILKNAKDASDISVVSDDNYVRNHAKAFGALSISAREFFKKSDISRSRIEAVKPVNESKINEELKKIWGV